jgi:hypothetical protein
VMGAAIIGGGISSVDSSVVTPNSCPTK